MSARDDRGIFRCILVLTVPWARVSLKRLAFVVLVHRIMSAVALALIFEVAVTPRAVRLNAQDT